MEKSHILSSCLISLFLTGVNGCQPPPDEPVPFALGGQYLRLPSTPELTFVGPQFSFPFSPGYEWPVNTATNDKGDAYHRDAHFYSVDFGRWLVNEKGATVDAGEGINDVLAMADGKVVKVVNSGCTLGFYDCTNGIPTTGTACAVYIDHGKSYGTKYLHFVNGQVKVHERDWVRRGQALGKMGNTGISCGPHVHTQVMFEGKFPGRNSDADFTYNGYHYVYDSSGDNPLLAGVKIQTVRMDDYKVGLHYLSTNGFTFQKSSSNPAICASTPTGGAETNWVYTCPSTSTIDLGRPAYLHAYVTDLDRDICLKAEWYKNGTLVGTSSEYCSSGLEPYTWTRAHMWPWFIPPIAGAYEGRLFVRLKMNPDYLKVPMATRSFTVVDKPPYTYNGNGQTCAKPPVGDASTNWTYTCDPVSTFSFFLSPTVYGLLYVENIFKNFKFVTKMYYNDQYLYTDDPVNFTVVEPWVWRYAYGFPQVKKPQPGKWRMEISLAFADGTPTVKLKDVVFMVTP